MAKNYVINKPSDVDKFTEGLGCWKPNSTRESADRLHELQFENEQVGLICFSPDGYPRMLTHVITTDLYMPDVSYMAKVYEQADKLMARLNHPNYLYEVGGMNSGQ